MNCAMYNHCPNKDYSSNMDKKWSINLKELFITFGLKLFF